MKTRKDKTIEKVVYEKHERSQHPPLPLDVLETRAENNGLTATECHKVFVELRSIVNSHDLLLTALKCLVSGNEPYDGCNLERARQAIAEAEGK